MIRYGRMTCLAVLLTFPLAAQAGEASRFTLGKAVPADVYVYIHGVHNPEKAYVEKYWSTVWKAFLESGVIQDVHGLIGTSMPQPEQERFEKFWTKAGELINGVDWSARVEEMVYTGRMGAPMPEYLVLLRYEEAKAQQNGEAFAAVLKEIAKVAGDESGVTFDSTTRNGATVHTLSFNEVAFINLRVAVRGPVVAVALDRTLLDDALAALAGQADKAQLIETTRYKNAIAKLPPAEDAVMFFDMRAMLDGIRGIIKTATSQKADDEHAQEVNRIIGKVLDEVNLFDYVASTVRTEGFTQVSDAIATLAPDAEKSRLYKVFKPDPIEKFDRFIPVEATGYSVCSGFDLPALYAGVLDFVEKEIPDGEKHLARWDAMQDEIGFHLDRDLFSWLGGQLITVSLPSVTPTAFSKSDSVLLIKVRDEKKAAATIKAGLDRLNDFLASRSIPLTSQPAEVEGAEGFRMLTHPMVMMFLRPVYGVSNGYLIIGTSAKAVEVCLATSRGAHPSVARNQRVQREAVIPEGPVASASFSDLSTLGQDIAQVLNALGFVSMFIPDQPELKPVKGVITILGKLGPVAEKIDFMQSTSSASTFDGQAWHTRKVMNYREPRPETAPESAAK